jgi:predicted RNA-binding protein with PIN domain
MALLIDGYNLLHVTEIFGAPGKGTDLHRSRLALLDFLTAAIGERMRRQSTIVFDATGAPPGLPRILNHGGITVHFARRHSDADELIEELLEQHPTPRELLVVSSDHRVQRAARHKGASFVNSEKWYAELRAAQRSHFATGENATRKPDSDISRDEVAYWADEFAEAPPDDTDANPFPDGYADDVLEEG